jgi:hypothetical protein
MAQRLVSGSSLHQFSPMQLVEDLDMTEINLSTPERSTQNGSSHFWSMPAPRGESYHTVLRRIHQFFQPRTYLEIGVATGQTLELAKCPSIAVDPRFEIDKLNLNAKPFCLFCQVTSDDFFHRHDPSAIFNRKIDLAFLDGMHLFEFLLRDFYNTERYCSRNSIILLHDCMPIDDFVSRRDLTDLKLKEYSKSQGAWTGDVWKMLCILVNLRPDLHLTMFDASPTGLVAITNLDPASTVLYDRYFDIVKEYSALTLAGDFQAALDKIKVVETRSFSKLTELSPLFYL